MTQEIVKVQTDGPDESDRNLADLEDTPKPPLTPPPKEMTDKGIDCDLMFEEDSTARIIPEKPSPPPARIPVTYCIQV